jgi:hypothetical protein
MPVSHPFRMRLVIDLYQGFRAARSTPGLRFAPTPGYLLKPLRGNRLEFPLRLTQFGCGSAALCYLCFLCAFAVNKSLGITSIFYTRFCFVRVALVIGYLP